MKIPARILASLLLAWLMLSAQVVPAALPAALDGEPLPSLAPMLERVLPSVVSVYTKSTVRTRQSPFSPFQSDPFFERFFGEPQMQPRERRVSSLGSGVIIDAAKGHVITNAHVIGGADEINVLLPDGRSFEAERVGSDEAADIAVIRISAEGLQAVAVGDSDELRVGDFVVAIGNPFDLGQTATSGIVSALGRSNLGIVGHNGSGIEGYEDFIQTDASINRGNSGGALVNLRGELVGVNTAIIGPSGGSVGIGFAIPVNMARQLTDQIIEYGEVRRGRLGVVVQPLTPELAEALDVDAKSGAVVSRVMPDSAAAAADLHEGDVIVSVDGREISDASELRNMIGLFRAGDELEITYLREGGRYTKRIRIRSVEPKIGQGLQISKRLEGARLTDVDDSPDAQGKRGVRVVEVAAGSPAWRSGLREGDLILSVNKRPIYSLQDVEQVVSKHTGTLLLTIGRGDSALLLVIR